MLSSVPSESASVLHDLRARRTLSSGAVAGELEGRRVIHMTSGMGIANAAHAATVLMERHKPDLMVLFGIGGAYPGRGLDVGDLVLAEREIYADAGVLTGEGPRGLEEIGIPLLRKGRKKFFNTFPLDRRLMSLARRILGVEAGAFLTVSQATGTLKRALELRDRFDALCENMEGAAVAQVCSIYDVPLLEVRGISNIVEDRNPAAWEKGRAAEKSQKAVLEILMAL